MCAAYADRIVEIVYGRKQALLDLLERMVSAESPSSHPDSHRLMYSILTDAFESLGFNVSPLHPDRVKLHVYARPSLRHKGMPAQLLLGHFDTVWPLGTVASRPFTIDGNVVRGPGVLDMKGGLAQIVMALSALRELRLEPQLLPIVFLNSDEEIGSRSSTRYIRKLARHVERALVMEPALGEEGVIKTERKGIGRYTVKVFGKAAHAGLDPESGASAILELSHVIQSLFALNDSENGVSVNVGMVDGGLQPNVIAPHSTAVVDVRVPTIADGERVEHAIRSIEPVTPGVRIRIDGGIGRPSMEKTQRNDALWEQARDIGRALGMDLQQGSAGGGSDGNTTSQYTATLDGLGPVGHGAHAEREFLYIDKTLERIVLLAMLIMAPATVAAGGAN